MPLAWHSLNSSVSRKVSGFGESVASIRMVNTCRQPLQQYAYVFPENMALTVPYRNGKPHRSHVLEVFFGLDSLVMECWSYSYFGF